MSTFYSGKDRMWGAITITSSNNQVVYAQPEFANYWTLTIPEGVYWNHLDTYLHDKSTSGLDIEYPSLLLTLKGLVEAKSSNTYEWQIGDSSNTSISNDTVDFVRTSGTDTFEWTFSSANFTLDPSLLGFAKDRSTNATSSSGRIDGTRSLGYVWQSPVVAADKRSDFERNTVRSDRGGNAYINSYPTYRVRGVQYIDVDGPHVYRGRADTSSEATRAGLITGDDNNVFEDVWRASGSFDLLVLHNKGEDTAADICMKPYEQGSLNQNDPLFEVARLEDASINTFRGNLEDIPAHERYRIQLSYKQVTQEIDSDKQYQH